MHLGSGNERVRTGEARGGRGSDAALRDLHTRFQRVTRRFLASRPNRRRRYPLAPAGVAVALVVATATLLHWPQDQTVSSFISSVGSFGSGVRVVDGDTIDAVVPPGRDRRRYPAGFDTPETYYARCDAERALGDRATRRLQELVRRDDVRIEVHGDQRDRYGRGLATLRANGEDVGLILIREGLAVSYSGRGRRIDWCAKLARQ
jgi:endonuclease YncB( thermonuclease family)